MIARMDFLFAEISFAEYQAGPTRLTFLHEANAKDGADWLQIEASKTTISAGFGMNLDSWVGNMSRAGSSTYKCE